MSKEEYFDSSLLSLVSYFFFLDSENHTFGGLI